MKRLLIFFLLIIFFAFFFPIKISALPITLVPTQVPTLSPGGVTFFPSPSAGLPFTQNCGFASVAGSDQCCSKLSINQAKQGISVDPLAQGLFNSISDDTLKQMGLDSLNLSCYLGEPDNSSGTCICKIYTTPNPVTGIEELCNKYSPSEEKDLCSNCARGGGILTGIGCIPINLSNFISSYFLSIGVGLAGIIALLCIIYSAFQLQTSAGNPEKVKKAQELLTSCIMGLMLIIFSIFILRLIGVNILQIPGFS